MREYKFRGKRKDNGEWVYGYYFIEERDIEDGIIWRDIPQIQQRYGDHFQYFDVDLATVGQYTGLHDKNGKEIYEGDIVVHRTKPKEKFIVVWHDNGFMLEYEFTRMYEGKSWQERNYSPIYESYEIISNIHDNPELLKEVE